MLLAERAVLSDLHPLGMVLLFLGQVVVPSFAFRARQRDSCTQNFHLAFLFKCRRRQPLISALRALQGTLPEGPVFPYARQL